MDKKPICSRKKLPESGEAENSDLLLGIKSLCTINKERTR
jgi:hypothetical protein